VGDRLANVARETSTIVSSHMLRELLPTSTETVRSGPADAAVSAAERPDRPVEISGSIPSQPNTHLLCRSDLLG
jgi:hypothetical protein